MVSKDGGEDGFTRVKPPKRQRAFLLAFYVRQGCRPWCCRPDLRLEEEACSCDCGTQLDAEELHARGGSARSRRRPEGSGRDRRLRALGACQAEGGAHVCPLRILGSHAQPSKALERDRESAEECLSLPVATRSHS
eukprot:536055-Pleurochrysis_carterae.AAC.3